MRLQPCPPLTWSLVELSTVCDSDPLGGFPRPWTERLHFLDHVHSFLHAAKDNMPAIQPKWRTERFIITAPRQWGNPWCPTGLDSRLFVGWCHRFCNGPAVLGRHSNLDFYFLLSCQNIRRIHCLHREFYSQQGGNCISTIVGQYWTMLKKKIYNNKRLPKVAHGWY